MQCYFCFREAERDTRVCEASAVCQRCGAGICGRHAVEISRTQNAGPGGGSVTKTVYYIMCARCYDAAEPVRKKRAGVAFANTQPITPLGKLLNRWRRKPAVSLLPEPEEAIAIAEALLKNQYPDDTEPRV